RSTGRASLHGSRAPATRPATPPAPTAKASHRRMRCRRSPTPTALAAREASASRPACARACRRGRAYTAPRYRRCSSGAEGEAGFRLPEVIARQIEEPPVVGAQANLAHQHRRRIGAVHVDAANAEAIDVPAVEAGLRGKGRAITGAASGRHHAFVRMTEGIREVVDLPAQETFQ